MFKFKLETYVRACLPSGILFRRSQPFCRVLTALFHLLLFHATLMTFDRSSIFSNSLCYTCSSLPQIPFEINNKCCYKYGSVRHQNTSKREVNRIPGPDAKRLSLSAAPQWEFPIFRTQQTSRPCLDNWFLSSTHEAAAVTVGWPHVCPQAVGPQWKVPAYQLSRWSPTYKQQTGRLNLTHIHT